MPETGGGGGGEWGGGDEERIDGWRNNQLLQVEVASERRRNKWSEE